MRIPFLRDKGKETAYDWIFVLLAAWMTVGAYVDGWAHNHLDRALETFFTPWHALLYSGFGALALFCVFTLWSRSPGGRPRLSDAPEGYQAAFLGVPVFMAGGVLDMLWHVAFGVERDIEALLSPTHLMLAVGAWLLVSGPFVAALRRGELGSSWTARMPALLSMALSLSIVTFMLEFNHPLAYGHLGDAAPLEGKISTHQSATLGGILVYAALLAGYATAALRRLRLPFGAFTLLLGINTALLGVIDDRLPFVIPALAAGLVADLLCLKLRPSGERLRELRIFAFCLPALSTLGFFGLQAVSTGVWWTIHLWAGAIVIAGLIGALTSLAAVPPQRS